MALTIKLTEAGRKLRQEVSRLSSMANKRLMRLRLKGYTDSPAYKSWEENGAVKFGVKGKSQREVQAEYWRLKKFLDNRTSTVRGANSYLKEMARSIGAGNMTIDELKIYSSNFFKLAQKISEYDKSLGRTAQALDYQKIWTEINKLMQEDNEVYNLAKESVDSVEDVENILNRFIEQFR